MILWFAGVSFVFVWWVFRSPALDYRLVMLGSILPVGEVVLGGPRILHTLLGPVALLVLVMLATQKRRLVRRRWIGIPIGMLMHLVLDGIWARAQVFWWPFFGTDFGDGGLPELGHSARASPSCSSSSAWPAWRGPGSAFGFSDRATRDRFLRTGHLNRLVEQPPSC